MESKSGMGEVRIPNEARFPRAESCWFERRLALVEVSRCISFGLRISTYVLQRAKTKDRNTGNEEEDQVLREVPGQEAGRDFGLTDVEGKLVEKMLA